MRLAFYRSLSRQLDNAQGDELRRLTTKAQPRRVKDVARVSDHNSRSERLIWGDHLVAALGTPTDNAHRRWQPRFVTRIHSLISWISVGLFTTTANEL